MTDENEPREFEEVYPPDNRVVIKTEPPEKHKDSITIYRNDLDEGTPWILREESSEVVLYTGLSDEQKEAAHKAIHNAIDEADSSGRTMFR